MEAVAVVERLELPDGWRGGRCDGLWHEKTYGGMARGYSRCARDVV
jgi:hypothetical protein